MKLQKIIAALSTRYFGFALFLQEYMRNNKSTFISVNELYRLLGPFNECWKKCENEKVRALCNYKWRILHLCVCVCVVLNGIKNWYYHLSILQIRIKLKNTLKNIYIYRHFSRGNANVLDLSKTVIEIELNNNKKDL